MHEGVATPSCCSQERTSRMRRACSGSSEDEMRPVGRRICRTFITPGWTRPQAFDLSDVSKQAILLGLQTDQLTDTQWLSAQGIDFDQGR